MKLVVATAVLAAALLVPSALAATPRLTGTVGSGYLLTLKKGTANVTKLRAGTYVIQVTDTSAVHNFRLKGPGVNKTTSLAGKGKYTWTVRLRKGTYVAVCDPHARLMRVSFTVA
jgi:plastocyanin